MPRISPIAQPPMEGMICASCAARIERKLNRLDGVSASVNYAIEKAIVDFDPARLQPHDLIEAVGQVGYAARLPELTAIEDAPEDDPTSEVRRRLLPSAALALPVLLMAMIPPLQFNQWQWLSLQLATPVVVWGGWPLHRVAWQNLPHGGATMDTLISVGTSAAYVWSLVALFFLAADGAHEDAVSSWRCRGRRRAAASISRPRAS